MTKVAFIWSLCSTAILWLHSQLYSQFISDKALISLRYAERFLNGQGLSWNDSASIEGYSNLLWILLTAGITKLGFNSLEVVHGLGFIFNASVIFALFYIFNHFYKVSQNSQQSTLHSVLPLVIGQLFWVCSGSIAVWTMGGLEQPLFTASLIWALALLIPALKNNHIGRFRLVFVSLLLTITALTRVDGPLFTLIICAVWWWQKPKDLKHVGAGFVIALLPTIAFISQTLFRLSYYGDILPHTSHSHTDISSASLITGLKYTIGMLSAARPFFEITLLGLAFAIYKKRNHYALGALLIPAFLWTTYIAIIGGDAAPAFRYGLPLFGLIAFALLIIAINADSILERTTPAWLQWCLVAFCFIPFLATQIQDPENKEAFYEKWELDGEAVGKTLKTIFAEQQPLYAMATPGALAYWSELPALDLSGLNTPNDIDYLNQESPDIYSFCSPAGNLTPCKQNTKALIKTASFHENYIPLYIQIEPDNGRPPFINIQWIKWQDGVLGALELESSITIPAYLGATSKELAAQLQEQKLVVNLKQGEKFGVPINLNTAQLISQATNMRVRTTQGELTINGPEVMISKLTNNQLVLQNRGSQTITIESIIIVKPSRQVAVR